MKKIASILFLLFTFSLAASPCDTKKPINGIVTLPETFVIAPQNLNAQLYSNDKKAVSEKFPVNPDGSFEIKYNGFGRVVYVFDKDIKDNDPEQALLSGYYNKKLISVNTLATAKNIIYKNTKGYALVGDLVPKFSKSSYEAYGQIVDKAVDELSAYIDTELSKTATTALNISAYSKDNSAYKKIIDQINDQIEIAIDNGDLEYSPMYLFHTNATRQDIEVFLEKVITCEISNHDISEEERMKLDYIVRNQFKRTDSGKSIAIQDLHLFNQKLDDFYISAIGPRDWSKREARVQLTPGYAAVLNTSLSKLKKEIDVPIVVEEQCKSDCYSEALYHAKQLDDRATALFVGSREQQNQVVLGCIWPDMLSK